MYNNLLPIGSVVLLKEFSKKVMICGRIQTRAGDSRIYSYSACYYPEGIIDLNKMFFFDNEAIDSVLFVGFQDTEEISFRHDVLEKLGNLEVKNGKIIKVESKDDI